MFPMGGKQRGGSDRVLIHSLAVPNFAFISLNMASWCFNSDWLSRSAACNHHQSLKLEMSWTSKYTFRIYFLFISITISIKDFEGMQLLPGNMYLKTQSSSVPDFFLVKSLGQMAETGSC